MDSKGFLASFVTAVLLISNMITYSMAAPLTQEVGRWVNPCGDSAPAPGTALFPLPMPPPQPINSELQSLKVMSLDAVDLCVALSNAIKKVKQYPPSVVAEFDLEPTLQGFPNDSASFTSGLKPETALLKEVDRVSKIGVFLEQARLDTNTYTMEIRKLEDKCMHMLCKMHTILKSLQKEVTSIVSRDIMLSAYKTLTDTTKIDGRNYVIARDAEKIFVAISEGLDMHLKSMS